MKKSLKYFSLFLALILVLTGCGKKNSTETKTNSSESGNGTVEEAFTKTFDSKGCSLDGSMTMQMSAQGMSMDVTMKMKGDAYYGDTMSSHITTDTSMMGMNQTQETYTVVKDGEQYTYQKSDNDGWEYTKAAVKTSSLNKDQFLKYIKEAKENKKVDSDKEGYTKYEITLDSAKLASDLNLGDSMPAMDIKFNVYVKDGYVSIIDMDLSDLLKSSMGDLSSSLGSDASLTAKLTIEFSNFGNVSEIVVPQDVISSAKETKDLDSSFDLFN